MSGNRLRSQLEKLIGLLRGAGIWCRSLVLRIRLRRRRAAMQAETDDAPDTGRRRRALGGATAVWARTQRATDGLRRSFREHPAWTVASITGTLGIALLLVLQISQMLSAAPSASKAETETQEPQPEDNAKSASDVQPPEVVEDPFAADFATENAPDHQPSTIDHRPAEPPPFESPFFEPPPPAAIADETPARSAEVPQFPPREDDSELTLAVVRISAPELNEPDTETDVDAQFVVTSQPVLSTDEGNLLPMSGTGDAGTPPAVLANGAEAESWDSFDPTRAESAMPPMLYHERLVEPDAENEAGENLILTSTEPGPKHLHVSVTKVVPDASTVNQPLRYEIVVRNEGEQTIERVVVEEQIPEPHQISDVFPPATLDGRTLRWQLKALQPDDERKLSVQLVPKETGTVASVATIRSMAAVTADTRVRGRSNVRLEVIVPERVGVGGRCPVRFRISNSGPDIAAGVVLQTDLPQRLSFQKGRALEYDVGTLAPGETREALLVATGESIGNGELHAKITLHGAVVGETERTIVVSQHPPAQRTSFPQPYRCWPVWP